MTVASRSPLSSLLAALVWAGASLAAAAQTPSPVQATGPDENTLEDAVEVTWSPEGTVGSTSVFHVKRGNDVLHVAASTARRFTDRTAAAGVSYTYCVQRVDAAGSSVDIGCDTGGRALLPPTGFAATDGGSEDAVSLTWQQWSQIEDGYVVTRDAGNALRLNGSDAYMGTTTRFTLTPSFTFEFWARRATVGTDDYVVNFETGANGGGTDLDVEIGFNAQNKFVVRFNASVLATPTSYTDTAWHHWAVVYEAPLQRRVVYRDGEIVATDVAALTRVPGVLEFGRRTNTGGTATRGHFGGDLDEVRYWTAARAPAEVRTAMTSLLQRTEAGLGGRWPMDVAAGTRVPDALGAMSGTLVGASAAPWVVSGAPERVRQLPADATSTTDASATPGFQRYTYHLVSFDDLNGDGRLTPGTDAVTNRLSDTGWRGLLTPPEAVAATDGEYRDRVRITWTDRSNAETGYTVYRNDVLLGTTAALTAGAVGTFDHTGATGASLYCVAATGGGSESVRVCDQGAAGALQAPTNLAASRNVHDDRIVVTWSFPATNASEDGFELTRDGQPLATLAADAGEYNDLSARPGVEHAYCVRSFSQADPVSPSYSEPACTATPGRREIVLAPTGLTATGATASDRREDRIELAWQNPSATALLFKIYRDTAGDGPDAADLIEIVDASITRATDRAVPSGVDVHYFVTAVTVLNEAAPAAQSAVAQVLRAIRMADEEALASGGDVATVADKLTAVGEVLGVALTARLAEGQAVASEIRESVPAPATGRRLLPAPTAAEATRGREEGFVQVTWTNAATTGNGVYLYRAEGTSTPVRLATLNGEPGSFRTSYKDFAAQSGVLYTYSVRAFDTHGESEPALGQGFRTLNTPTDLVVGSERFEDRIELSWTDASAAEDGYVVSRRPAGSTAWTEIGRTGAGRPAFVDTDLGAFLARDVEYQVVAFDRLSDDTVTLSTPLTGTGRTLVYAPASLHGSSHYSDRVVVVWVDRSGVETGYRLTRTGGSVPALDISLPAGAQSYTDQASLRSNTVYQYCVRAVVGGVESTAPCQAGRLGAVASVTPPPDLTDWTQYAERLSLTPSQLATDGAFLSRYGTSVSVGPDGTLLVGAPDYKIVQGAAAFVPRDTDGGPAFLGTPAFGEAVDIGSQYAVVHAGEGANSAVPYERSGTSWQQLATTLTADGGLGIAVEGAFVATAVAGGVQVCTLPACASPVTVPRPIGNFQFGRAIDLEQVNDTTLTMIVGASALTAGASTGAYIYECDLRTGCNAVAEWPLVQLIASPFSGRDVVSGFGQAVALGDTLAVIGAPGAGGFALWERVDGRWEERTRKQVAGDSRFGTSVAVDDGQIIVGAPAEDIPKGYLDAGAAYTYTWTDGALTGPVRYDATVAGTPKPGAAFGTSVAVWQGGDGGFFAVGAPSDLSEESRGAVYTIPIGLEPPSSPVLPSDVTLVVAEGFVASDGAAPDRIHLEWTDASENEDGYIVYRSNDQGVLEPLTQLAGNTEIYEDYAAAAGETYEYCVVPFGPSGQGRIEGERVCDVGWRPANGAISGLLQTATGTGVAGVEVCLTPNPNRSLLFDGVGGFVEVDLAAGEDEVDPLMPASGFTIEAWVRPRSVSGTRTIVARPDAFAFTITGGTLAFTATETGNTTTTFTATVPSAVRANEWSHVAVVKDGLTNDILFYLNGQPLGAPRETGNTLADASSAVLTIGARGVIGTAGVTGADRFDGEIDELRIWATTRTAEAIGASRPDVLEGDETDLVGYWRLDEGRRRLVPDISDGAHHGVLRNGVYQADAGAPLDVCATTDASGNYRIAGVRYGTSEAFEVRPVRAGRAFAPSFSAITLSTQSPVQNQVLFNDVTSYTVTGSVLYGQTFTAADGSEVVASCAAPNVSVHAGRTDVATNDNMRGSTGADGGFTLALDPGAWFVRPRVLSPDGAVQPRAFAPMSIPLTLTEDHYDVNFVDTQTHTLSGYVSGGDPQMCGQNIGKVTLRIRTEDGCYDRAVVVDSGVDNGRFEIEVPPLAYLLEVESVQDIPAGRDADEIVAFFQRMGAVEVDLSADDVERNLTYRAPLTILVAGLDPEPNTCSAGLRVSAADGTTVRTLPNVAVVGEYRTKQLDITVVEDYGRGDVCTVEAGRVVVYDGIADRADEPTVFQIQDFADSGYTVPYLTYGASPNPFSGARIEGVDRSYQKPLTVFAEVEGRDVLRTERWAVVEGARARASTFVSATTEPFPALILHDPPGSNSFATMEEGRTMCNRISQINTTGGGISFKLGTKIGAELAVVTAPLGFGTMTEASARATLEFRAGVNVEGSYLTGPNQEICISADEVLSTSSDPGWVGEDIHVGVALNLIFAIADVVEADASACSVELSETLAADINDAEPFETTYAYGTWHIERTLIPELENLIRLAGGDPSVTGEIGGSREVIRLRAALDNWRSQLRNNSELEEDALQNPIENRSFSGGTEYTYSGGQATTELTYLQRVKVHVEAGGQVGFEAEVLGQELDLEIGLNVYNDYEVERDSTETTTSAFGYTLMDADAGDYFSVDVAKDPRYGSFVFGTRSGRSSNTCEAGTQCRDNPVIAVNPPARYNVDPADPASFQLTLTNASESNERRRYVLAVPGQSNPGNLEINVGGVRLGMSEPYLLDPGRSLTVNMDAYASPSELTHERVAVVMYPPDEFPIWAGEMRGPFALSDTAFFDVNFDGTGGNLLAAQLTTGWNWVSINREGGDVGSVLGSVPASHGDVLRSQRGESRYDSTDGWGGAVGELRPGEGYRLRLRRPGELRVPGQPFTPAGPLTVSPGWNWVGYVPARRMTVAEALGSLGDRLRPGDAIVGQRSFAQYVDGVGWVGTLDHLLPGQGYALYVERGGELRYPAEPAQAAASPPTAWETTTQGPDWTFAPETFDASMIAVAEIALQGAPLRQTTTKVGVLDGDRVVGTGEVRYVEALDRYLTFFRVYGDVEGERDLRVHVYDGEADVLYEDVATLRYAAQSRLGDPAYPVAIDLANAGMAPELLSLPDEVALYANYPNPLVGTTTIGYDLPEQAAVRIAVYDVLGREVAVLVDGDQPAGRHSAVFDGRSVAAGTYIYRMEVGDASHVRKMTVVR